MANFIRAIEELKAGKEVKFRPHGNSMKGRVESGELVTVAPCNPDDLQINDIVLVKVKGKVYLHLIKAFGDNKKRVLIGNNKGHDNGWTSINQVYGKLIKVEP